MLVVKVASGGEEAVESRLGAGGRRVCAHRSRRRREEAEVGCGSAVVALVALVSSRCGGLMALCLAGLHQSVEVKLVGVPLAMNFGHDVLVVVIPENQTKDYVK